MWGLRQNRRRAPARRQQAVTAPTFQVLREIPPGVGHIRADERLVLVTVPPSMRPGTTIQARVEGRTFHIPVPPKSGWRGNQFYAKVPLPQPAAPPAVAAAQPPQYRYRAAPAPVAPPGAYGAPPPAVRPPPAYGAVQTVVVGGGSAATNGSAPVVDAPLAEAVIMDDSAELARMPIATGTAFVVSQSGGGGGSSSSNSGVVHHGPQPRVGGSPVPSEYSTANPFQMNAPPEAEPEDAAGSHGLDPDWLPGLFMEEYRRTFYLHEPVNGKLTPDKVRDALIQTGTPVDVLREVWELADADRNGELDLEEFALAMFLCTQSQAGQQLPDRSQPLPRELMPPSKR